MVARLGRASVFVASLLLAGSAALAQATLRGDLHAAEVRGYVVIACHADAAVGCDEALSAFTEIASSGTRAAWSLEVTVEGPFLLLAWLDADGDGEAQDGELVVLRDASGEPALVTAPASGLVLRTPGAPADAGGAGFSGPPLPGKATPATTAGALPPDLVGVWQQTRASAGDYRDVASGGTFSMTSGFTTTLKLRPDGAFEYVFYSSGVATDCAFVSYLERAVGSAAWTPGRLVLTPSAHELEVSRCDRSGRETLGLEPMVFAASLTDGFDLNLLRTWTLTLDGGPVPLVTTLLDRPPLMDPPAPSRPADFVLGADPPYAELQGTWTPRTDSRTDFYDPATQRVDFPESGGYDHGWVRFVPGGYEMAQSVYEYTYEGVCKKDLVYYERGTAEFAVTDDLSGTSIHAFGHARFTAGDARLIVRVRECGVDDGVVSYPAPRQTSYYSWIYQGASNEFVALPEVLTLGCPWAWTEFQPLFCGGSFDLGSRTYGRHD